MKTHRNYTSLQEGIRLLQHQTKTSAVSIKQILSVLPGKGRLLIILIFSLPFCQPLQIPGLSTPFGIVILFIGIRMIFGKQMWLPKRLLKKTIPPRIFNKITTVTLKYLKKMNRWIHPRWPWIGRNPIMDIVHGSTIMLLGFLLALPLPIPFSNLAVAWPLLFLALGLLEDDGLFVLIGYLSALATFIGFTIGICSLKKVLSVFF